MTEHNKCCGCSACASVCPQNCISMNPDRLGFLYPIVDEVKCVHCNMCEMVCPALDHAKLQKSTPYSYGGHAVENNIRRASSSGGIFTLLAEHVLRNHGVVFGAVLSEDYRSVQHIMVEEERDLYRLRGSKYVQSDMGNCYTLAKEKLDEGISVLFSGTPCQIHGLNLFLRKRYENLVTVEIICHGTPSPKLYQKYIDEMELKLGSKVSGVFFRDEIGGGILFMRIVTEKGIEYREDKYTDLYYRMFLSDTCLRESCYDCPSRGLTERADITLSDFWGVENVASALVDGEGLSLITMHTEKGRELFENIKDRIEGHEVSFEAAIKGNQAFYTSYRRPSLRDAIENDINRLSMNELSSKYSYTPKDRIRNVLKKVHLYGLLKKIRDKVR